MNFTLQQLAEWSGGSLIQGAPSDLAGSISTDSRTLGSGDTFLALKGENFDGHDFVGKACEAGVSAMIISGLVADTEGFRGGVIHVRDTLVAFQSIARSYRRTLTELFAVGVTGSNGKTSTKDFLRAVLEVAGPVNATLGNLNNHIGLPQTILKSTPDHRYGVWEMGMNHPGEIEVLAEIAQPDAGVITNIGMAHIEHMKTQEAIAVEKGQLAEMLPEGGFFVMPAADSFASEIGGRSRARLVRVGIGEGDVRAASLISKDGGTEFNLIANDKTVQASIGVMGEHMVINALLAATVGIELGVDLESVAEALSNAELTGGRLQKKTLPGGIEVIDDSYNANPDSMKAGLNTLVKASTVGRRVAVLGFMGELGELEESAHRDLGSYIKDLNVDLLVTVSPKASWIAKAAGSENAFETHKEAADFLRGELKEGDVVLVKGSRAAAMEKVIELLSD